MNQIIINVEETELTYEDECRIQCSIQNILINNGIRMCGAAVYRDSSINEEKLDERAGEAFRVGKNIPDDFTLDIFYKEAWKSGYCTRAKEEEI